MTPAVIFVTAYDEYAVKAFELNAVDYLLKPFTSDRLNQSVDRALVRLRVSQPEDIPDRLQALLALKAKEWPARIAVRTGERFELIATSSIQWMESADNYVKLHCGNREYLLSETLTGLVARLDPRVFRRIHRTRAVNLSRVTTIYPMFGGIYDLELIGGIRLTTGRQYRDQILELVSKS